MEKTQEEVRGVISDALRSIQPESRSNQSLRPVIEICDRQGVNVVYLPWVQDIWHEELDGFFGRN